MDADVWVRRSAIAVIPLVAIAIWLLESDPSEAPAESEASSAGAASLLGSGSGSGAAAPGAAATRVVDGPRGPSPSSGPSVDELERAARELDGPAGGERRLAGGSARGERTPAPKLPSRAKTVAAVELPVAEAPSSSGAGKRGLPAGPCGGVEVRLITDSDDPEWAFASLSAGPDDPARMRRIGDQVGQWKLVDIEWDRVWLSSGGSRCAVGMHAGIREAQAEVAGASSLEPMVMLGDAEQAPPLWRLPQHIASGIEQQSVTEYSITRAAVDAIYAKSGDLLSGLALRPIERNERVVGIELGKIQVDSLLERLGLRTGDVVLSIDERPCITLSGTIAALEGLRDKELVVARLERQGEPFVLQVRVV
jgi:hypothetical protein